MALARQLNLQPKRKNKGVKEPDLFSRGSLDKLYTFIFQCQIYFCICKGEFVEDTEKIFFMIFCLCSIALDCFEPFINKADLYQNLNFLEEWLVFIRKLSNLFRSCLPEDNNEDAIMAILFSNDSKAINYFIRFIKYQNRICWDDRSLYR